MAQSLRTFQSTLGFSDASAFSAHSAVKLEDIVISQENSAVPGWTTREALQKASGKSEQESVIFN